MRVVRTAGLLIAVILFGFGIQTVAANGEQRGKRDPLDAQDIRTAGAANHFVEEHFPGTYGGYWVKPMQMEGPFTFHFAWTAGMKTRIAMLNERFPLNRGTYVAARNEFTWTFLLDFQRQVSADLRKIKRGELKAPGKRPWEVGSYPSPERDCLVLEKGPMEKSFRKWAKRRYGDQVCLDEMYSGW